MKIGVWSKKGFHSGHFSVAKVDKAGRLGYTDGRKIRSCTLWPDSTKIFRKDEPYPMRFLLAAVNAKYIHSNPAVYSLRAYAEHFCSVPSNGPVSLGSAEQVESKSQNIPSTSPSGRFLPTFTGKSPMRSAFRVISGTGGWCLI